MADALDLETLATIYADVGGVEGVPAELLPCLPRGKFDEDRVQEAARRGFPAIEPILPHLLMWLQDRNWPISESVASFLRSIGEPLTDPIRQVLRSWDDIWKYSVLTTLVKTGPPRLRQELAVELQRIAEHPSDGEVAETLPEVASEILRGLARTQNDLTYENDGFRAWVDGASIQIKAVTAQGEPVDFGTGEVREIIAALARMVKHLDEDGE
jgi:hypothetical protein